MSEDTSVNEAKSANDKASADEVAKTSADEASKATPEGPLTADEVAEVTAGYTFEEASVQLGVLVNGEAVPGTQVRVPLGMFNRHGLVAGATGTGKTKTLQVMAEQLSTAGVPIFAADIKGDLSGLASPGEPSDKLAKRSRTIGQDWQPTASPCEFYALGGVGMGIPVRATISSFGPILLSKVMGLTEIQESSLGLVFHYADEAGLPLLDLKDLTEVLKYLTSDDGKEELKGIGGLSSQTAGVILRELVNLSAQGADDFFGEPEFDTSDLLRTAPDGRGIISLMELLNLADRPALFSTFLMWLLADMYADLPEVGDTDKPKLVFFFDEAHLLFNDASKAFKESIAQTVRLIRSKGVGVFFVTQTPKDVPDDVLAQLGSRVQHQLRAHTPNDAKALKATVATYPKSGYELGEVLQELGIGEAVVTVMDPDGAPTPVAWIRILAPQSLMAPTDAAEMDKQVKASSLYAQYGTAVDRDSAYEMLTRKLQAGAEQAAREAEAKAQEKAAREAERDAARAPRRRQDKTVVEKVMGSSAFKQFARSAGREIVRALFGTATRRR